MDKKDWKEFLEEVPPYTEATIEPLETMFNSQRYFSLPLLSLHCPSSHCNGERFFGTSRVPIHGPIPWHRYFEFTCQNCGISTKLYSIEIRKVGEVLVCRKLGELPQFGKPIPSRVIAMVGPDKELFLKGRRCENQGLGLAAFTYYRRVIENQRNRIFDELERVLNRIAPSSPVLEDLKEAKKQRQFTSSMDSIKHALPDSLAINGHNPLVLLHQALSDGIHNRSDEDCLERATAIRTVLAELCQRIADALKDDRDLADAIKLLTKKES